MNQEVMHVYMMPGLAANPSIFENIKLPVDQFQVHWLEWLLPEHSESLSHYAQRMSELIEHENFALVGVSFGGILVQEMSTFIKPKKLIIVSSVKSNIELPPRMKLARRTRAYRVIPTELVRHIDSLSKYPVGKTVSKRLALYKKYLSVNDKLYLDWAIRQVICWERSEPIEGVIHIHGDKDGVFPLKNIQDCIVIEGGTHIMILNRYRWFNRHLPKLLLDP